MNALDLIKTRLAAKKQYLVTTVYADNGIKTHETETLGQAENYATMERRKVGKALIDRSTGKTVFVVDVIVVPLS